MSATQYTIRRKILTLFGAKFHIYDASGALIGFSQQKAFKLKEDIRVFTDETLSDERLAIKARSIIDFGAAYDVFNSRTAQKLGSLKRKGLTSIVRDSWLVMDAEENEVGKIQEDSMALALVRRFLSALVPQSFHLRDHTGAELANYRTHVNPFVHRMTVTVYDNCSLDPMLVLAGGILLVAIEGRQG
jgi:hypothetical protein